MIIRNLNLMIILLILAGCKSQSKTSNESNQASEVQENNKTEEAVVKENGFGSLLAELESNMGWNSVNPDWKSRRDSWLTECNGSSSVTDKGNLLLEFETYVEWSAVNPEWANRRDAWIQAVLDANSDADLGELLVEFESYVLWDVVSPDWVNIRESWVERCNSLPAGAW